MFGDLNLVALGAGLKLNSRGRRLFEFNGQQVLVSRFSDHPRWEIHPEADEYLQVIDGTLGIVLLEMDGEREVAMAPNDVCVVPKNVWHSPVPAGPVTLLSIGTYDGTRISNKDDPR
jgi:mannose-6-phosphate isomerase-like protein (cupin superfamily)